MLYHGEPGEWVSEWVWPSNANGNEMNWCDYVMWLKAVQLNCCLYPCTVSWDFRSQLFTPSDTLSQIFWASIPQQVDRASFWSVLCTAQAPPLSLAGLSLRLQITTPPFCCTKSSSGLRICTETTILQQIDRVLWLLKCYPCPPAPVLAHTTWDQSGSLRLADRKSVV